MEPMDQLMTHFSRFRTGFVLSKAILEDYCEVVARIEGKTPEEIKERINAKAVAIDQEIRTKDKAQELS